MNLNKAILRQEIQMQEQKVFTEMENYVTDMQALWELKNAASMQKLIDKLRASSREDVDELVDWL
jgi:ribose 5-phosphate isomerase